MKKITIKLPTPEKIGDKEITELEFREPIGADMEEFLGEIITNDGETNIGKGVTALATRCIVSHSLSAEDIKNFNAKNYMAVANRFMGFMK